MTQRWLRPPQALAMMRRRYDSGELLGALARGQGFEPVGVPLRPPSSAEVARDFGEVQDWARQWLDFAASHGGRIEYKDVGGRLVGVNAVPARFWADDADTLWRLLGVRAQVRRYEELRRLTGRVLPELEAWTVAHPREVLANAAVWERLLAAVVWIRDHSGPAVYLRQIDVPAVDTKFVERNRAVVAAVLDEILPPERIDTAVPRSNLAGRFALAAKPGYARLRRLDGGPLVPVPDRPGPAELGLRVDDLAAAPLEASRFVVIENEITYLAFPPMPDTVAVFGEGYAVARLAPVAWLRERDVHYWGDLDTHGLAILDHLRAHLPGARSFLMDAATLLEHEAHWSQEDSPRNAPLPRLTEAEAAVYADLVEGRYGERVRLEQERVRFGRVRRAAAVLAALPV